MRFTQDASSREGAGDMALRCLPYKCEDQSLVLKTYGFFFLEKKGRKDSKQAGHGGVHL